MTIRYRYQDIQDDLDVPFVESMYNASTKRNIDRTYVTGGSINYTQKDYTDKTEFFCGVSTKYTVEGEKASLRTRPDIYHRQNQAVYRPATACGAYEGGWWKASEWAWSTGALASGLGEGEALWPKNTVNRNVFWIRPPETGGLTVEARDQYFLSHYGTEQWQRGTYCGGQPGEVSPLASKEQPKIYPRMRNGDLVVDGITRSHPYHEYGMVAGGTWNQIIMDEQWDMCNKTPNTQFSKGWWINPHPFGETHGDWTSNYFDILTWTYWFAGYYDTAWQITPARGYDNCSYYTAAEQFYVEDHEKDKECDWWVHGLMGSYHPNRGHTGHGEFAIGFNPMSFAKYMCEVVYAYVDMHQWNKDNPGLNAFDEIGMKPAKHCTDASGTPMLPGTQGDGPGTSVMPWAYWNGDTQYGHEYHMTWWTSEIDVSAVPPNVEFPDRKVVYFAIRPTQGTWDANDNAWGKNVGDPTYENLCGPWDQWFGNNDGGRMFRQICVPINTDLNLPSLLPPHLKRTPENI